MGKLKIEVKPGSSVDQLEITFSIDPNQNNGLSINGTVEISLTEYDDFAEFLSAVQLLLVNTDFTELLAQDSSQLENIFLNAKLAEAKQMRTAMRELKARFDSFIDFEAENKNEITELRSKVAKLEDQLKTMQEHVERTDSAYAQAVQEKIGMEQQQTLVVTDLLQANKELDQQNHELIIQLTTSQTTTARTAELTSQVTALEQAIKELQSQLRSLQKENQQLKQQNVTAENQLENASPRSKVEKPKDELKTMQEGRDSEYAKFLQQKTEMDEQKSRFDKAIKSREDDRKKIKELEGMLPVKDDAIKKLQEENNRLKQVLQAGQSENQKLTRALNIAEETIKKLTEELKASKDKVARFDEQVRELRDLKTENGALSRKLGDLRKQVAALQAAKEDLEKNLQVNLAAAEKQKPSQQVSNQQLDKTIDDLQKKIRELQQENEKLRTQLEKQQARIDNFSKDKTLQDLAKQLEEERALRIEMQNEVLKLEAELRRLKALLEQTPKNTTVQTQQPPAAAAKKVVAKMPSSGGAAKNPSGFFKPAEDKQVDNKNPAATDVTRAPPKSPASSPLSYAAVLKQPPTNGV